MSEVIDNPKDPLTRRIICGDKERFTSFSLASKAAKRKAGRQVYHCPFCEGFHVGSHRHKPKRQISKKRGRQRNKIRL